MYCNAGCVHVFLGVHLLQGVYMYFIQCTCTCRVHVNQAMYEYIVHGIFIAGHLDTLYRRVVVLERL